MYPVPQNFEIAQAPHQQRIVAWQNGELLPMFGGQYLGPLSPSPTLLIERHDLESTDWQTHSVEDNVLTLFLKPTVVFHALEQREIHPISLASGSVVSSLRRQQESICWKGAASFLSVALADSVFRETADCLGIRGVVEIIPRPGVDDPRLTALLHVLDAERQSHYAAGGIFLDGIEQALATLLITSHSTTKPPAILRKGGLAPHMLRQVIEFMHQNVATQIVLNDLANCAGLSTSHFSHQFRESTGTTPHQYLLTLRVDACKRMLRNPKLSILAIALATGFQSQQHLATVFRRIAGVSPSSYRRQL
jgi:AraC family transcriptional regulator